MLEQPCPTAAPTPIHQSYWVIPGRFLAGEYPREQDGPNRYDKLRKLEATGVTLFLDLTQEGELLPYASKLKQAQHRRFPIRDVDIPRSPRQTADILDAIDNCLDGGGTVYLHCWGGVGRTGTIVGCWLARHGCAGNDALALLSEIWEQCPKSKCPNPKKSPETPKQENYVRRWREEGHTSFSQQLLGRQSVASEPAQEASP